MAIAEDFRFFTAAVYERVVSRNPAIVVQTNQRACMVVQVLCAGAITAIAQGNEQVAVVIEYQARTEMLFFVALGKQAEDDLDLFKF
jgi:hypothetical protein